MQSVKIKRFVAKNIDRMVESLADCPGNNRLDSNFNSSIRFLDLFQGCIVEYQDIYKLSVQIVV